MEYAKNNNLYAVKFNIQDNWKKNVKAPSCPYRENNSRKSPRKIKFQEASSHQELSQDQETINKAYQYYMYEINNTGAYDLGAKGPQRKQLHKICEHLIYDATELKKRKSYSAFSTNSGTSLRSGPNADTLLRQLQKERNTMAKLGFIEKAEEIDIDINALLKTAEEERKKEEHDLLQEQIEILNKKSERRRQRLDKDLYEDKEKLLNKQALQLERLLHQQKKEFIKQVENTQRRAIGKLKMCNCPNWYVCRHNKTASYNTRRPTPEVVNYKRNSARLKKKGQMEEAMLWEDKALELDDQHQEKWRKKISQSLSVSPWGPNDASADKLIDKHKHDINIMKDTHKVEISVLDKKQERRRYILNNIITAEENRLKVQVHKQYLKIVEERIALEDLQNNTNAMITDDLDGMLDYENEDNKTILHGKVVSTTQPKEGSEFAYENSTNDYWNSFKNRTSANEEWVPPTHAGLEYSERLIPSENAPNVIQDVVQLQRNRWKKENESIPRAATPLYSDIRLSTSFGS